MANANSISKWQMAIPFQMPNSVSKRLTKLSNQIGKPNCQTKLPNQVEAGEGVRPEAGGCPSLSPTTICVAGSLPPIFLSARPLDGKRIQRLAPDSLKKLTIRTLSINPRGRLISESFCLTTRLYENQQQQQCPTISRLI